MNANRKKSKQAKRNKPIGQAMDGHEGMRKLRLDALILEGSSVCQVPLTSHLKQ